MLTANIVVISIYSKNGGKAGAHAWVSSVTSIGSVSYLAVQTYEAYGCGRIFNTVHHKYAATVGVGLHHYSHIPSNTFLMVLSPGAVAVIQNGLRITEAAWNSHEKLLSEIEGIIEAVKKLNKVNKLWRKAKDVGTLADDDDGDEEEL
ncbi:hypothetical protein BT96DRAFT_817381 [Gymnopus androsaceus JB14]|uniref:Uncharacterized protein n=1 Tax=Gymnopus androsaceus JB14 TaxID=1447944 RepID=A0A6A4HXC7_9AGAR|nr:hypothetical protein BT96DRAFT_817381 [Gymnopus androsaceus JB14]